MATGAAIQDAHTLREGCPVLARVLLALGDAGAAEAAARRGLESARSGGFRISEGRNLRVLGRALWERGLSGEAVACLEEAEQIFRTAGARFDLAAALYVRAVTGLEGPSRAAALGEALDLARGCGAGPLAARIGAASGVAAPARDGSQD
jgi:hypothetical protein